MRYFKIEYSKGLSEKTMIIDVFADNPRAAIEQAGLLDAWEYTVSEEITRKLGSRPIVLSIELIRRTGRR